MEDLIFVFQGIHFKCNGTTGHGSLLHKRTAGEKARYIIDQMMDFRKEEERKLENNPDLLIGDVTTVNLTIMKGGVQSNVLPAQLTVVFDVRLALNVDHDKFEAMVGGASRFETYLTQKTVIFFADQQMVC